MFSDWVNSGFFMYMAEAEGMDNLINTRTAKLNAIRNELRSLYNFSFDDVEKICLKHDLNTISEKEYKYIIGVN